MKMIVNVYESGSVYIVNRAYVSKTIPVVEEPDSKNIKIEDTQVFSIIAEALLQKNEVRLPTNITTYKPSDVIINVLDDLDAAKYAAKITIKNFIAQRENTVYMYDLFEFNLTSNILYSEGYFITDSNREKKYLEIIGTNNATLIDALEKYLNIRDKISEYYSIYAQAKAAIELIENATTIPNVDTYKKSFLASFK